MASTRSCETTYPVEMFTENGEQEENAPITLEELEALSKGQRTRADGRKMEGHRPISINAGTSANADGSAYAELGNTKLYCVVNGPHEVNRSDATSDTSWRGVCNVTVAYSPLAQAKKESGQSGDDDQSCSSALTDAFSALVILEKYPRSQIDVLVTIIEDDGGVLPLALMACSVALSNAGIETYDVVVAASLLVVGGHFFVDPTSDESLRSVSLQPENEKNATIMERSRVTFGLMPSINQVICLNQEGQLTGRNVSQALKLLADVCHQLYPVVRKTILNWTGQEKGPAK